MDFRTVDSRVPETLFEGGEIRIYLGTPETRAERRRLERIRDTLHALKRQGDWQTLRRIKDGELSAEEVYAAVRRVGLEAYPMELRTEARMPPLAEEVERWLETLSGLTERNYRSAMKRILQILPDGVSVDVGRHRVREVMDELRRQGLRPNTRTPTRRRPGAGPTPKPTRCEMVTEELLEEFKEDLRRGTDPDVARSKIRSALIRRHGAGAVARKLERVNHALARAQAQVEEEEESCVPDPAA